MALYLLLMRNIGPGRVQMKAFNVNIALINSYDIYPLSLSSGSHKEIKWDLEIFLILSSSFLSRSLSLYYNDAKF